MLAVCCVVVAVVVIVFFFHDTEACVGLLVVDFVAVDAQVTHLMKKRIELNRNSAHCQTKEIRSRPPVSPFFAALLSFILFARFDRQHQAYKEWAGR